MQRLAYAGSVIAFRTLWALMLVLILLGMTAGAASAQTASPPATDTPSQVPGQAPTPTLAPPAMTWITIRPDTPEEREVFLQQRAISQRASITVSATLLPSVYATARRGGLRGAGGILTAPSMAANIERGFCPKNRSAAVVPSGRVRRKLCTAVRHSRLRGRSSPRS